MSARDPVAVPLLPRDHTVTFGDTAKGGEVLIVRPCSSHRLTVNHALGSTLISEGKHCEFEAVPAFSRLPGEGEDEPVPAVWVPRAAFALAREALAPLSTLDAPKETP
jgi:hypothetical protein